MYRPPGWMKSECEGCKDRVDDQYGKFLCNLTCGKHTAWLTFEAGADAMLRALIKDGSAGSKKAQDDLPNKFKAVKGTFAFIPEDDNVAN